MQNIAGKAVSNTLSLCGQPKTLIENGVSEPNWIMPFVSGMLNWSSQFVSRLAMNILTPNIVLTPFCGWLNNLNSYVRTCTDHFDVFM